MKQLVAGLLSPKLLMGPVGIVVSSYQIVEGRPLVYYAYFLGLISASIAVLNLMPMPPFDGGLIVLMLVEKIKGSAAERKGPRDSGLCRLARRGVAPYLRNFQRYPSNGPRFFELSKGPSCR